MADWDATNTALEAGYQAAAFLDWKQTSDIAASPKKFYEKNPILGRHPSQDAVNTYFAATGLAHILGAAALPEPYRKIFQSLTLGIEATQVGQNLGVGLKIGF